MNAAALVRPWGAVRSGDRDLAQVLANRYGDGSVYLPSGAGMGLYHTCVALGLVSTDGFITNKGRRLVTRYSD